MRIIYHTAWTVIILMNELSVDKIYSAIRINTIPDREIIGDEKFDS